MTTALIDGDIVCYRCAASCEKQGVVVEPLEIALARVDDLMGRIIHETAAEFYYPFLTGSNNFRHQYNPTYKANRKDMKRPDYLETCREHLVVQWKAQVSDGCEADDHLAIEQTKNPDETIICTIDKDLLQVPGRHYNFVKQEFRTISPIEGRFNFYWQFIMGDKSDNIMGYDGIARQAVPKKLEGVQQDMQELANDEVALFNYVRDMYELGDDALLMNGICLWMQRHEGEIWQFPQ